MIQLQTEFSLHMDMIQCPVRTMYSRICGCVCGRSLTNNYQLSSVGVTVGL